MFCTTFAQPARCHAESSIRNKNTFLDFKACVFLSISKTPKNKKAKKKKGGGARGKKRKGDFEKNLDSSSLLSNLRVCCRRRFKDQGQGFGIKGLRSRVRVSGFRLQDGMGLAGWLQGWMGMGLGCTL